MSFLNPLFLAALIAVAIPLAIHFWRIRKPEVLPFSSLVFFQKLKQKAIKRLRLKEYILLALRVLAIAGLALALARPFLPPSLFSSIGTETRRFVLVIDNSASMQRVDGQGPYIDQAKQAALQILDQAQPQDQFVIFTTQGTDQPYSITQWLTSQQGKKRVQNIQVRQSAFELAGHWRKLRAKLNADEGTLPPLNWYLIGDSQQSATQLLGEVMATVAEQSTANQYIQSIKVGKAESVNLAVQSMEVSTQMLVVDKPFTVTISVTNTGERDALNQYVTLKHNENLVGQYEADIEAGNSREFSFEVNANRAGLQQLEVHIEGDDVTFDNTYRASVMVPRQRNILYISETQSPGAASDRSYFQSLIKASKDSESILIWETTTTSDIDVDQWAKYDGLIWDGLKEIPAYMRIAASEYVQNGGGLMIFPNAKSNIESYNRTFEELRIGRFQGVNGELGSGRTVTMVQDISRQHPIFQNIFDLSSDENQSLRIGTIPVEYYYRLRAVNQAPAQRVVIGTETQDPILVDSPLGEGRILVSTIGLSGDWSQLPFTPLFAPLWYQSALYLATGASPAIQSEIIKPTFNWTGPVDFRNTVLNVNDVTYQPELRAISGGQATQVEIDQHGWEPGWVKVVSTDTTITIGLNLPFSESIFEVSNLNELEKSRLNSLTIRNEIDVSSLSQQELKGELKSATFGQEIWQWFLVLAVILLVIEIIITIWYQPIHSRDT